MSEDKKEIEIVTGNGKDLEISPVYDHIKINTPSNREKKKGVIIPKSKSEKDRK
ncbi:MAG: hypothetical protein HFJ17_05830 [Clostridia bacterium]|nr:hypothetical protein [Clostridia bacterium]